MSPTIILSGITVAAITVGLWAANKVANLYADRIIERHKATADRHIEWASRRFRGPFRWVAVLLGPSPSPAAPPEPPPPVPAPAPTLPASAMRPVMPAPDPTTRDTDLAEAILAGMQHPGTATGAANILEVASRAGVTDHRRVARVARMLHTRGYIDPFHESSDSVHGKITAEAIVYFEAHGSFRGILGS